MLQNLQRIVCRLTSNQRKFVAEIIGTFIVVVLATGSVVIDAKTNGILGIPFIAFAPFIGAAIAVYLFGKISMAHFNPAVSVGFLITKHITRIQLLYYLTAEIIEVILFLFPSLPIERKYLMLRQSTPLTELQYCWLISPQ